METWNESNEVRDTLGLITDPSPLKIFLWAQNAKLRHFVHGSQSESRKFFQRPRHKNDYLRIHQKAKTDPGLTTISFRLDPHTPPKLTRHKADTNPVQHRTHSSVHNASSLNVCMIQLQVQIENDVMEERGRQGEGKEIKGSSTYQSIFVPKFACL
jgi:hypothetical protein